MAENWNDYQEEVAEFFRSLGLEAQTNFTLQGVRTKHDVDVLVKSHHVGFDITWIVECKFWNSKVSKLHVLALREIVADVGADRGILLAESGFQSGALEAASLTNVHITSLANVQSTARAEIFSMRLRELYDRVEICRARYWHISKDRRIEVGLRSEVGQFGYSGARVVDLADDLLQKAFRGIYPVEPDPMMRMSAPSLPAQFATVEELVAATDAIVQDLESRLNAYEASTRNQP